MLREFDLCANASYERGNCQESHGYNNDKTALSQVLSACEERREEKANPDHHPDNRKMIQQKVQMCEVYVEAHIGLSYQATFEFMARLLQPHDRDNWNMSAVLKLASSSRMSGTSPSPL